MSTGDRVSTYLTLLSTLTLQKTQGHDVSPLEERLHAAWDSLSTQDRIRVQDVLHVPASKPRRVSARARLRLVRKEES